MRLRGNGLTLTGAEGKSPPLPFITVDDGEGEALLSLYPKSIIRVDDVAEPIGNETLLAGEDDAGEDRQADAFTFTEPAPSDAPSPGEDDDAQIGDGGASLVDGGEKVPNDVDQTVADKRFNEIADAIDLLDTASFVSTGPRKGRPKVKAVEEIIGYDVTMEEVDQVFMAAKAD